MDEAAMAVDRVRHLILDADGTQETTDDARAAGLVFLRVELWDEIVSWARST